MWVIGNHWKRNMDWLKEIEMYERREEWATAMQLAMGIHWCLTEIFVPGPIYIPHHVVPPCLALFDQNYIVFPWDVYKGDWQLVLFIFFFLSLALPICSWMFCRSRWKGWRCGCSQTIKHSIYSTIKMDAWPDLKDNDWMTIASIPKVIYSLPEKLSL